MAQRNGQICCLLWFNTLLYAAAAEQGEIDTLLSFKASVGDPLHFLSSWNSSTPFCDWGGVTCNNDSHVTLIELSTKNLTGRLFPSLFFLPSVATINLSSNEFYGEIPAEIFSSSSLRHLNLSNNNFSGSISPPKIPLPNITTLDVSNNMLSGAIPEQLSLLLGLEYLDFGGNAISGKIPKSISELQDLQFLTLASNDLQGEIPPELGRMTSLQWIYLGYNNLSGVIPTEIGNMKSLRHLDLVYNNLTGKIPSSLGNLTNLQYLFLYQNRLCGSIPPPIFSLRNLIALDLSDNSFSGQIPGGIINLQKLELLHLFSNNLTGRIPEAVSDLPRLKVLQLWSNQFVGGIPSNLGKISNLTSLDLSTNSLSGEIPEGVCHSGNLFKLILFSNFLTGKIPKGLSSCRSLQRVRLQNNRLSGNLPPELTRLPLVYYLDLSGNDLTAVIDDRNWEMTSLRMLNLARNKLIGGLPKSFGSDVLESIDLSENILSSSIPASFGGFRELVQLNLAKNQLSGTIPAEISLCEQLVGLDVSNNQLSGPIPAALSLMPALSELDLSQNRFSGELPQDLGRADSLVSVNISYNSFRGRLPLTPAFLAANYSSIVGNNGLCGGGISTGLPACRTTNNQVEWVFLSILVALGMLLALSIFFVFFVRRGGEFKTKKLDNEEGAWDLQIFDSKVSRIITVEDILGSLREENALCIEQNCVVYRGISTKKQPTPFTVKRLCNASSLSKDFWTELASLGKIQHRNVVKMLGICQSETDGFLLYEFVEGKRLGEVMNELSWKGRCKVAVGIARALSFLHYRGFPQIILGNMPAENVIVDGNGGARLKLNLPGALANGKSVSTFGHVAPEMFPGKEFSEQSDVYALGVILLQLVTGKQPNDPEFGEQSSMVEWARYCYSDCHLEAWVDTWIRSHVAAREKEIVQVMNLAIRCTARDPSARPSTADVCKILDSAGKSPSWWSRLKISLPDL